MKKESIALVLLTCFALSCSKEDLKVCETEGNKREYTFNISVSSIHGDTKAAKTDWEEGDMINLWFDGATSDPQVIMTYSDGEWILDQKDASLSLGEAGRLTALYEGGNEYSKLGKPCMPLVVSSTGREYQLNGSEVEATIGGWIFNTPYQIVVPGIETGFSGYSLYCKDLSAGGGIELESASGGETVVKIKADMYGRRTGGTGNADGAAFYFTRSKMESEQSFVFYLTHSGARYSYTTKATTIGGGRANKKLPAFSVDENGNPTTECKWERLDDEYVDLGLSVKWATCNIGASTAEEYGDYFAWGETETYYEDGYALEDPQSHWKSDKSDGYDWSSYKYGKDYYALTKYCNDSSYGYNGYTDSKILLDQEDDAAYVNWGGAWRMPTISEWEELCDPDNCTVEWYESGNTEFGGIAGCRVTSNKPDYTDRWIFLPAAGDRIGLDIENVDEMCAYWSNSLYIDFEDPSCAYFQSLFQTPYFSYIGGSGNGRSTGLSVRPVCQ